MPHLLRQLEASDFGLPRDAAGNQKTTVTDSHLRNANRAARSKDSLGRLLVGSIPEGSTLATFSRVCSGKG